LVITSPSFETKEAEQPPAIRTEPSMVRLIQPSLGVNPYSACIFAFGKLSKVHIPSAAIVMPGASSAAKSQ